MPPPGDDRQNKTIHNIMNIMLCTKSKKGKGMKTEAEGVALPRRLAQPIFITAVVTDHCCRLLPRQGIGFVFGSAN